LARRFSADAERLLITAMCETDELLVPALIVWVLVRTIHLCAPPGVTVKDV